MDNQSAAADFGVGRKSWRVFDWEAALPVN